MGKVFNNVLKNLKDEQYMVRACRIVTNICMTSYVGLMLLSEAGPAMAASANLGLDAEIGNMFSMFKGLSDLFIKIAYGMMILIFAVGMVKSGLTAQAAQQFGASGKVSGEIMNVIGGLVIFIFGMLSYPLVSKIIDSVVSGSNIAGNMSTDSLTLPGIGN